MDVGVLTRPGQCFCDIGHRHQLRGCILSKFGPVIYPQLRNLRVTEILGTREKRERMNGSLVVDYACLTVRVFTLSRAPSTGKMRLAPFCIHLAARPQKAYKKESLVRINVFACTLGYKVINTSSDDARSPCTRS